MSTSKKDESARSYRLKTERALIKLHDIQGEYLPTTAASALWTLTRDAALTRLDKLPGELLKAVRDRRSSPGEAQAALQATVYQVLTQIASGADADRAVKLYQKKCRR